MTITETINLTSEFLWDEDAPEILLNNLPSFNERTEDIVELTSYLDEYGTDKQKNYLPYFQSAIRFDCKNTNQSARLVCHSAKASGKIQPFP